MKDILRKFWWVIIAILGFPLILNFILIQPRVFNTVGDGSIWLSFWVTYLSAIASFAMVLITWITLKENRKQNKELISQNENILEQNKEQLNELKRQWNEANRPYLVFSIIANNGWYLLKIDNVGNVLASMIELYFNEEFISVLQYDQIKDNLNKLKEPFCIPPHATKYYFLAPLYMEACYTTCGNQSFESKTTNEWLNKHISDPLLITGKYSDKFVVDETLSIAMFSTPSAVVNDPLVDYLGWIKKGIVFQNNQHAPIQKSIEEISKSLKAIEQTTMNKLDKNKE